MRLSLDLALSEDDEYHRIVTDFTENRKSLDGVFDKGWCKLTTSGGQWVADKKCIAGTPLV